MSHSNLMRRVLKPATVKAGMGEGEDAGWHADGGYRDAHVQEDVSATRLLVEIDPVLGRPWVIDEVQAISAVTARRRRATTCRSSGDAAAAAVGASG